MIIFYSWQSWSEPKYNRYFIEDALERAVNLINEDHAIPLTLVIDRDTTGRAGTVAIADTILEKIDRCEIFVGDVTLVTPPDNEGRSAPNPNVLIELGYAVKHLSWRNIICVVNRAYGAADETPFDLRHRRLAVYNYTAGGNRADAMRHLSELLYDAILVIAAVQTPPASPRSYAEEVVQLIDSGAGRIQMDSFMEKLNSDVLTQLSEPEFQAEINRIIDEEFTSPQKMWQDVFAAYLNVCRDALEALIYLAWYGPPEYAHSTVSVMRRWISASAASAEHKQRFTTFVPSILAFYAIGIAATANENWEYVSALATTRIREVPELQWYKHGEVALNIIHERILEIAQGAGSDPDKASCSTLLQTNLYPLLGKLIPYEADYVGAFDVFEFVSTLVYFHNMRIKGDNRATPRGSLYAENGNPDERSTKDITEFLKKARQQGRDWILFQKGVFTDPAHFEILLQEYHDHLVELESYFDFPRPVGDYLQMYRTGNVK